MHITYKSDLNPSVDQVIELLNSSGLKRPTGDRDRIAQMYAHANLIISAWDADQLIGIARSLTDFSFCCYLSDLAVSKKYQQAGIGKELVKLTKEKIGPKTMLLLLSVPTAMEYYPKIGMDKVENAFIINRTE
ncbi:GCN5 family acetyltransferase [Pedobacter lusitanus]|uniref:GCN5 family acetyltransferase n=2 Tax=Pedobacter lusitanus TaxID=1503925 RepID=A0A0D0GNU7_9SPHI|nr:GCN5 family acetyltransferase [Pedobacter lusitanus]